MKESFVVFFWLWFSQLFSSSSSSSFGIPCLIPFCCFPCARYHLLTVVPSLSHTIILWISRKTIPIQQSCLPFFCIPTYLTLIIHFSLSGLHFWLLFRNWNRQFVVCTFQCALATIKAEENEADRSYTTKIHNFNIKCKTVAEAHYSFKANASFFLRSFFSMVALSFYDGWLVGACEQFFICTFQNDTSILGQNIANFLSFKLEISSSTFSCFYHLATMSMVMLCFFSLFCCIICCG